LLFAELKVVTNVAAVNGELKRGAEAARMWVVVVLVECGDERNENGTAC
jgi:hypothetical protein